MNKRNSQPPAARILVVEDDQAFRDLLHVELEEKGFESVAAGDLQEARELLAATPGGIDLILSDLRLPDGSGRALLAEVRQLPTAPNFIALTAFGTIQQAVELLKEGADDFLTKPLDFDQLGIVVARVIELRRLRTELSRLRERDEVGGFHGIMGDSPAIRELIHFIMRVAPTDESVLILGESGTGKELVAQAVHAESERAENPFVPLNCAAIPAELIESELFGHEAGAFTGAQKAKPGLFASASGGTLFLDEIGEMPIQLQAKLLRVLQEGTIRRIGAQNEISVDARIVAASHRDLREEVRRGNFREDLFYRLEALTLTVPPLREREGDIEIIALSLLDRLARSMGRKVSGFAPETLAALQKHPLPGNVRELGNLIKKMLVFAEDHTVLGPELLPEGLRPPQTSQDDAKDPEAFCLRGEILPMDEVRRLYLLHALKRLGGNKKLTAEKLGIGRRTLYDLLPQKTDES